MRKIVHPAGHSHVCVSRCTVQGILIFFFSQASRPFLEPNQPPTYWLYVVLSPWYIGRSAKVTINLHLSPRLRINGSVPPKRQDSIMSIVTSYGLRLWFGSRQGKKYLYLLTSPDRFWVSKRRMLNC
jgi:hypothetical protein